jgi:hypothetical protein
MLNESELERLLEVAEKARETYRNVRWFTVADLQRTRLSLSISVTDSEHIAAFDPTTCAELAREVLRLRAIVAVLGDVIEGRTTPLEEVRKRLREESNHDD